MTLQPVRLGLCAVLALAIGCGGTTGDLEDDAATPEDVAVAKDSAPTPERDVSVVPPLLDGGTAVDAPTPPLLDGGRPSEDGPAPVDVGAATDGATPPPIDAGAVGFCARATCVRGTLCCESQMRCIDPSAERCEGAPPPVDAGAIDSGPSTSFCARALCVRGTVCCESLMRCLGADERCPDAPPPVDAGTLDAGPVTGCTSTRECGDRGECVFPDAMCARSGTCQPRIECLRAETFCSCAGETYRGCRPDRPTQSRGECDVRPVDAGVIDSGPSFCALVRCVAGYTCCESARACIPNDTRCGPTPVDAGTVDTGPTLGCTSSRECGARGECVFADSMCARSGTCMPAIACLRAETFCACTGETYMGCRPDRSTQSRGACATSVDAGTAGCRSNADCARGSYCAGDSCDGVGSCTARPEVCTTLYSPVCGCNGVTFSNACGAASAGVRVASRGACRALL